MTSSTIPMKSWIACIFLFTGMYTQAQIGIGTTSPNSTLDVRGSLSVKYTAFTNATSAGSTDNTLVFTGTSATTLTLPDATACQGRIYWIKNSSSNSSTLTIATTSAQTVDGLSSWSLTQTNKVIGVVSNGTNWLITSESQAGASGTPWVYGGNNVTSLQNIGTTSNYHLPFITNNTEKMRLTSGGSLGIGTSTFNATYPEKLLVDAGSTGNTNYQNVLIAKGNTNSYVQLNLQNGSTGSNASTDLVATANNGTESINFIDMGINGGGNSATGVLGGANTAYLYATGDNFVIGNGSNDKSLNFFTTQSSTYTEKMRLTAGGFLGLGTASPGGRLHVIAEGSESGDDYLFDNYTSTTTQGLFLRHARGTVAAPQNLQNGDLISYFRFVPRFNSWLGYLEGSGMDAYYKGSGTDNLTDLRLFTTGTERIRISETGTVGVGTTSPNATVDVNGSIGTAITLITNNTTLDATHSTIIISAGSTPNVTLPSAASSTRRIYTIVNQTSGARTISSYRNFSNAATTTVATTSSITIQSDGSNWYQIR
jgi:hypothetical protein